MSHKLLTAIAFAGAATALKGDRRPSHRGQINRVAIRRAAR